MTSIKPEEIINTIVKGLREKGLKLTPQRLEIINILAHDGNHPSALTIYRKAREKAPTISLSTVYYTLSLLKRHRLIKELEFHDMENRYEGNPTNHINLICLTCRCIEDYCEGTPTPTAEVETRTGFRTVEMRLEYYGYCRKCLAGKG